MSAGTEGARIAVAEYRLALDALAQAVAIDPAHRTPLVSVHKGIVGDRLSFCVSGVPV